MRPSAPHTRKQNQTTRTVWTSAFFLILLVAVTTAFLVSCFLAYIHRSDYQINLYQGLVSKTQNAAAARNAGAAAVSSTAAQLTKAQAQQFDFKVSDNQNVWSTDTTIELFEVSYRNDNGQITVQSADKNKVIAPGTGGSYTFSLNNSSDLNSNYQVWLEADLSTGASGIPIEFRMSGSDGWTDGKGEWLTADELNKITARKNLYSGKSTEYTLYWRWAFERGEDSVDTAYGNMQAGTGNTTENTNVSQSISYKVTLHTLATEGLIGEDTDTPSDSSNNTDQNGNNSYNTRNGQTAADNGAADSATGRTPVKTADTTDISFWIRLLAAAGIVAASVLCLRNRRKVNH